MWTERSNSVSILAGITSHVRNESTFKILTKIKKKSKTRAFGTHLTYQTNVWLVSAVDQSKIQRLLKSSKQVIIFKSVWGPSEDLLRVTATFTLLGQSAPTTGFFSQHALFQKKCNRRAVVKALVILLVY